MTEDKELPASAGKPKIWVTTDEQEFENESYARMHQRSLTDNAHDVKLKVEAVAAEASEEKGGE